MYCNLFPKIVIGQKPASTIHDKLHIRSSFFKTFPYFQNGRALTTNKSMQFVKRHPSWIFYSKDYIQNECEVGTLKNRDE
jgi:hypothetical protein